MDQFVLSNNAQFDDDAFVIKVPKDSVGEPEYTFTIVDGKVTAVTEHFDGRSTPLPINPGESYVLDGKDVIFTSAEDFGATTIRYTDTDGNGRYKFGSIDFGELPEGALHSEPFFDPEKDDGIIITEPDIFSQLNPEQTVEEEYSFTIVDGKVTEATVHIGDESSPLPIEPGESYVLDGKDVLYNTADDFGSTTTRYTDADGDGRYKFDSIEFGELPEGALYSPIEFNPEFDSDIAIEPGSEQFEEPEYSFTIVDGKITAVTEHIGDESFPLPIGESESYTLDGKDVLYNSADDFGSITIRYADADGDGRFKFDSIDFGDELPEGIFHGESGYDLEIIPPIGQFEEPEFSFTIADGKVTAATEHVGEESFSLPIGKGESYVVDGKDVVYNSADNFGSITIRYTDADGDGRFKVGSIDFGELPEGALYSESIVDLGGYIDLGPVGVHPEGLDAAILG